MGLIGSIIGGATSAIGGIMAGNKLGEQSKIYQQRMNEIKAHRDNLYYRDPTQSADNQAAVTQARELLNEQSKRAAATAAITGGSDESVAMAKKQASDTVGNMLQAQAVQGENQRNQLWNQADQQVDAYSKYLADVKQQQAAAITQAAGGLAGAAGELDFGKTKKGLAL